MRPASRPDHFKEDKTMALLYNLPGHDQKAWQREGAAINAAGAMRPGQTTTTTGDGANDRGALIGGAAYLGAGAALGLSTTPIGWAVALGLGSNLF